VVPTGSVPIGSGPAAAGACWSTVSAAPVLRARLGKLARVA